MTQQGHKEPCPTIGTLPQGPRAHTTLHPARIPMKSPVFSIEKVEKLRPINFTKTLGLKNK